jgi:hypothetical protein
LIYLGWRPATSRLPKILLAALQAAARFLLFLLLTQKKEAKKSVLELMRFLLRKTAAGPYRSRLSFCCAKRHSARSTAIAGNSGFCSSKSGIAGWIFSASKNEH